MVPSIRAQRLVRPGATPVVSILIGLVAAVAFLSLDAPDAVWHPQPDAGFSPTDPLTVQQVWPSVGTTVGPAATAARVQAAALGAVGLEQVADPVWIVSLISVVLASIITRAVGGSVLAAAGAALALAFGGVFSTRAAAAHPVMFGAFFALATIAAARYWVDSRRGRALALCAATYAAAVAVHPSALAALPGLLVFACRAADRARQPGAVTAAGALLAAGAAGSAAFWWSVGTVGSLREWFADSRTLEARLSGFAAAMTDEFGVLGLGFLAAGTVVLFVEQRRLLVLLAGWSGAVTIWSLVFAPPDWRASMVPGLAPAWIIAGAGMARLLQSSERRMTRAVAALVILVLPVMSFLAHAPAAARTRETRAFVLRYLDRLARVLPERSTLVAEGGLVDRSIVGQSRGAASGAWRRVPQDVSAIRALWESGATVVGFARARANLEELGVRFRPVLNAGVPMPLDEFLETIPEGWIVAAATSDRFRSDGREPDASFRALGGGPRLPDGESGRYGVIAVKAHRDQTLRQAGPTAVDLGLAAGDALGDSTRAPVAIRVSSGEAGAFVEVGGARVAETRTGVAVAVIAPTGELAGAFSAEAGEDLLVNPSGLAPAYVDVEPCANLPPDQWVDVSEVVGGGSIGAILEDDQTLVLYFGSRYPFDPRLEPLNHASVPDVVVTSYPAAGAGETVQAALARDEAAPALGDWPHVSRVEIQSPAGGRSQMALRLGGFVQAAQARVTAPDPSSDVSVCSAGGSGAEPIDAAGELADADIDLGADDLFVFGWDSLERTGGRLFRWSLLRTAGLLVPLAVPVDLRIEITATAAGSGMLKLHINDTELPPVALQAGEQVYRWTVSGKAWRRGLNRVLVQVPDLVRAVDLGAAGDDRLLGLSVSRIRLVRVNQAR